MREFADYINFKGSHAKKAAVTIGNFDGCHLGHQDLLRRTLHLAHGADLDALVMTFAPHPAEFFRPGSRSGYILMTEEQKSAFFRNVDFTYHCVQAFDADFAHLSARDFVEQALLKSFRAKILVVGPDFKFGRNREGNVDWLRHNYADQIQVDVCKPVIVGNEVVSSTRIRALLSDLGDVAAVENCLGRPYELQGIVIRGNQIGRTLGFPTANLGGVQQLLPKNGVYCGRVLVDDREYNAVINIGIRPTINSGSPTRHVEAHIYSDLLPADALYGKKATYVFVQRLRDEAKFASREALVAQIQQDIAQARILQAVIA